MTSPLLRMRLLCLRYTVGGVRDKKLTDRTPFQFHFVSSSRWLWEWLASSRALIGFVEDAKRRAQEEAFVAAEAAAVAAKQATEEEERVLSGRQRRSC